MYCHVHSVRSESDTFPPRIYLNTFQGEEKKIVTATADRTAVFIMLMSGPSSVSESVYNELQRHWMSKQPCRHMIVEDNKSMFVLMTEITIF